MWTSIKSLLSNKDIEFVIQGIDLWEPFILEYSDFSESLHQITASKFNENTTPKTLFRLKYLQKLFSSFPHKNYLAIWSLGTLAGFSQFQVLTQDLETLDLSQMKLSHLPENITQLKHLKILDLWNNQLSSCEDIFDLEMLEWLDLSDNNIKFLPDSTEGLKQLEWLDLKNNPISKRPFWLSLLPKLTYLNIKGFNEKT